MIWCKSFLVCFGSIHCDTNCFNPAVSTGLCCTYVYMFHCLVMLQRGMVATVLPAKSDSDFIFCLQSYLNKNASVFQTWIMFWGVML